MNFDIENYNMTKQIVIDKIKSTYKWETTEGFIADGLISPKIYSNQELKIICLLAESYGYDECLMVDIETQLEDNILGVGVPARKTSTKLSALLWLIYKSIENKKKLTWDDFPFILRGNDENTELLQDAISKSGWINVKKASKHINKWGNGATRQNYHEIYSHAFKNKEILEYQIKSTCPNLIIVCSNPVFDSLNEMELLGEGIKNQKFVLQQNRLNQFVIYVTHPGYFKDWGYEGIFKTFNIIYDGLMNFGLVKS